MTKPIYAIYGASGCGRSLMPVARQQLQRDGLTAELYLLMIVLISQQYGMVILL